MGLMWIGVLSSPGVKGPRILPSAISRRYLNTISCCSEVDGIFLLAALSGRRHQSLCRTPCGDPALYTEQIVCPGGSLSIVPISRHGGAL